jgi:hypothetical protein
VNVLSYIQYASFIFIPILAGVGSLTTILESIARSVGAGMLMASFVMAAAGLLLGWTRGDLESRALRDACLGGLTACVCLILDLWMRYFV